MENKVKDGNYYVVQSFMVKELQLKGAELVVFAIIYGYSQDGINRFQGSMQYLADWANTSKECIRKSLISLQQKGFIQKLEEVRNGVKYCEYYVTNKVVGYTTKLEEVYNKVGEGIQQSCTNNISNNKENNIDKETIKESWEYFDSPALDKAFKDYVEMRKTIKKPMTMSAKEIAMKKLDTLSKGDESVMVAILEQSTMNCWQGLFPIKEVKTDDWRDKYRGQE